jgi:hypothetical protein
MTQRGALGQDVQAEAAMERVVRQTFFLPFFPQSALPPQQVFPPTGFGPFTFEVSFARPVHTAQLPFGSWGEALSYASQLFSQAQSGQFGPVPAGSRAIVSVRDASGAVRTYPDTSFAPAPAPFLPQAFPPFTPYPYSSILPRTVRTRVAVVAGLGQVPPLETVNGLQTFPKPVADGIATNLAAMIWVPTLSTSYTAYSPGSYEVNFGAPPPAAPGYPGEATAPGVWVLANPSTVAPVDALTAGRPLDKIDVVVAPNREVALSLASPGDSYAVVLAPATSTIAEKRTNTAAIVAGLAAAAVAAILLFA